ncbi:hypothetical protein Taro_028194 [Colocasia esculenta]|uniref:Uncharacterized protein n=1 Tax=Colocasia esculenta TaxID=4460 RepID=A0A843VAL4_COLES|nr:hypothetical protein [Colocasia esculenta]
MTPRVVPTVQEASAKEMKPTPAGGSKPRCQGRAFSWDPSPKFSRGVSALKMAPGFPVKMKIQGEHVSVQSTSAEEIRQHKVYRPSTKDKYKKQARGRTPR